MTKDQAARQILMHFNMKLVNIAKAFNVSSSAVRQWMYLDGLPYKRAIQLEVMTKGWLKAVNTAGARFDDEDENKG